mmetsp:Transcript_72968/g.156259  ORF Transcript_72968/g.156259 Transcript_72968/m.156259 type:complete len:364 (-) Transcript_72968:65-1156(-)
MARSPRKYGRPLGVMIAAVTVRICLWNFDLTYCRSTSFMSVAATSNNDAPSCLTRRALPKRRLADMAVRKQRPLRIRNQFSQTGVAIALDPAETSYDLTRIPALALAGRTLMASLGVVAGLVALLYITSGFEALMHSTTGILSGTSAWGAAATGLAVGTLHTVAGPDHLAGLAPLVVGQRRSAAGAFGLGALWGSGHATGQLLIGMSCLAVQYGLVRMAWAPALNQVSGYLVGASLVAIGLLGFREASDYQEDNVASRDVLAKKRRFGWATYATGVLHGLSPDAFLFIAPALALPRVAAASHVAGVVIGTLVAMGACTTLLSALCRKSPQLKQISSGASSIAVLLGACILAASLGFALPLPGL